MRNLWLLVVVFASVAVESHAASVREALTSRGEATVEELTLELPEGWRLQQDAKDGDTFVLGFEAGDGYLTLLVAPGQVDGDRVFINGSKVTREARVDAMGAFAWRVLETEHKMLTAEGFEMRYVSAFSAERNGRSYYGYVTAKSADAARVLSQNFLKSTRVRSTRAAMNRSLSGEDYTGKKYYFGWGAAASGDPNMMHNEVKYDVLHTHDIFTKEIGGSYLGTTLIGVSAATQSAIVREWRRLQDLMTWNDMYVQYSSGHGSVTGLGVGVTYEDIAKNALSYPAREIIIFTMACHSGGLVDAFNKKKSVWQNWQEYGRTLLVMGSSKTSELSQTGPGTDPDQPNGPSGSAGSAFGHALWKALIGYADGHIDGVKDGFLSLGEIEKFTVWKTKNIAGHTPVSTGTYSEGLVMNRVPPKEFVDSLEFTTEGLTDDEILHRIQTLDTSMRLE